MKQVTVYENDAFQPPLLDSNKVNRIVIRSSDGDPILFIVMLADNTWGVVSRHDEDWNAFVKRYSIC